MAGATDPRAEASARVGGRYEVRVLEPSPPAVTGEPWFADDPVARGDVAAGRQVVSPVGTGDLRWRDLVAEDAELAPWCAERWLASYKRLEQPPPDLPATRRALHRLAERVLSPAREKANGKIGLRYTRGGFGTPFFGDDLQIRVSGTELIVVEGGDERSAPITTLVAAAEQIGRTRLPDDAELDEEPLELDGDAARALGDWYGFGASVLEELRARAGEDAEPSRVQLWPEHFDLAVELGRERDGARAAYGFSPGDSLHRHPYAYVAPWSAPPPGKLWQATAFVGAELSYHELLRSADQREAALEFMRTRFMALTK